MADKLKFEESKSHKITAEDEDDLGGNIYLKLYVLLFRSVYNLLKNVNSNCRLLILGSEPRTISYLSI